jgi:transposase
LQAIWGTVEAVLQERSPQFGEVYVHTGRPSIAPEKWLRVLLLQALYTARRERLQKCDRC